MMHEQPTTSATRILAGLLETRSGQQIAPSRYWRIQTALSPVLKTFGIPDLEALVAVLGEADNEKLHRIDEAMVVEAAKAAGFVVEASSELLRHPEDDRTQFVFAKGLRGATDRFVLRLRKPR